MTTYDFSPFYRSAIGIDRLARLFENANRADAQPSYPPYNVELVSEDKYRISMAIAGFTNEELDIETEQGLLKITGRKTKTDTEQKFLYRGIAERNFEHRFQLSDHVKVVSAKLDNGLLNIELVREIPEALKPRKIAIEGNGNVHLLERQAA